MKLLHVTFHYEFSDAVEAILERHEIRAYVHYPMMHGKDSDGKHYGTKVFPGAISVVQAQVEDEKLGEVLESLSAFKKEKRAHYHLEALVFAVEKSL